MSTSTYTVQPGDVLLVHCSSLKQATVEWQQSLCDRTASYHTDFVQVKGKPADTKVLFFVASEWYNNSGGAVPGTHISKIATKVDDFYEFKVDNKVRYGQKNAKGEARFIVYHDNSRNAYQHRFVSSALRTQGIDIGKKVAGMFGISGDLTNIAAKTVAALVGDPLRSF